MVANERYYDLTIQLMRSGGDAGGANEEELTEKDQSKIRESIAFIGRLFPNVVLSLCTAVHKKMTYVSQNCADVLGYSSEYLQSLTPADFTKLIHLNDIKGFKSCLDYVVNKKIDLRKGYRVIFYYRITNSYGEVIYVEDERIALQNSNGCYEHFVLYRNISQEESFCGTRVKIYKMRKDRYLLLQEYFPETKGSDLTSRQRDIIQSVLMGLSNQEIADKLNLSIYTVKNHKQTLFKKLGISTSLELTSLIKGVNKNSIGELVAE